MASASHLPVLQERPDEGPRFGSRHVDLLEEAIRSISIPAASRGWSQEGILFIHLSHVLRVIDTRLFVQGHFHWSCVSLLFFPSHSILFKLPPVFTQRGFTLDTIQPRVWPTGGKALLLTSAGLLPRSSSDWSTPPLTDLPFLFFLY